MSGLGGGGGGIPVGSILSWAGASAPAGVWLECNGQNVSRALYAALYEAVGTTWGVGDGVATFTLPDLRGRSLVGKGQGSGLTNRAMAATGGAEAHVLSLSEMPPHTHTLGLRWDVPGMGNVAVASNYGATDPNQTTSSAGSGGAHNNMPPFAVAAFYMKAG